MHIELDAIQKHADYIGTNRVQGCKGPEQGLSACLPGTSYQQNTICS